jgi:hypothetical protein
MQKWEYLFLEIVNDAGGSFQYTLNGQDCLGETFDLKGGKFFNDLGAQGWEVVAAFRPTGRDYKSDWPFGLQCVLKRPKG